MTQRLLPAHRTFAELLSTANPPSGSMCAMQAYLKLAQQLTSAHMGCLTFGGSTTNNLHTHFMLTVQPLMRPNSLLVSGVGTHTLSPSIAGLAARDYQ
jgi:hypothetical protein